MSRFKEGDLVRMSYADNNPSVYRGQLAIVRGESREGGDTFLNVKFVSTGEECAWFAWRFEKAEEREDDGLRT